MEAHHVEAELVLVVGDLFSYLRVVTLFLICPFMYIFIFMFLFLCEQEVNFNVELKKRNVVGDLVDRCL